MKPFEGQKLALRTMSHKWYFGLLSRGKLAPYEGPSLSLLSLERHPKTGQVFQIKGKV